MKKCINKRNQMQKSGAAAETLPKCQYFEQMPFLYWKKANKPTVSNLTENTSEEPIITTTQINKRPRRMECSSSQALTQSLAKCDALLKNQRKKITMKSHYFAVASYQLWKICLLKNDDWQKTTTKKRRLAKKKIGQLLYNMQYEEDGWTFIKMKLCKIYLQYAVWRGWLNIYQNEIVQNLFL